MGDMQRSIRFPDDLDARIAKIAGDEDRSFSYVVLRTLEGALAGSEPAGRQTPVRTEPAPPRSPEPKPEMTRWEKKQVDGMEKSAPKAQRRQKASDAMSAALARQQALNKPKGI